MAWLDAHAGSVQAVATIILVVLTAYYAWTNRALVQQTRASLRANARITLQDRLDRISQILVQHPEISRGLDEASTDPGDHDGRFHLAHMILGVLEEAYTQHESERSMTEEDWRAWRATAEALLRRAYMTRRWRGVGTMYGEPFRCFVDQLLQGAP